MIDLLRKYLGDQYIQVGIDGGSAKQSISRTIKVFAICFWGLDSGEYYFVSLRVAADVGVEGQLLQIQSVMRLLDVSEGKIASLVVNGATDNGKLARLLEKAAATGASEHFSSWPASTMPPPGWPAT